MPRVYPASTEGTLTQGTHKLGDDFAASIDRFKIKTMEKAEEIVRAAIMDLYKEIVETSPVDTGLFRANNQVGIETVPTGVIYAETPVKGATYPPPDEGYAESKLGSWKLKNIAYICNNLRYSIPLEYGHSEKQAPSGVYRKAALRFDSFLERQVNYRGTK